MADTKPNEISAEDYNAAVFEEGGSLVINLSGVQEMKFELIPKGVYPAKIDSAVWKKSKKDAWMYEFQMELNGGDFNGRKLYYYCSFSQGAIRGTKTNLMRIDPTIFAGQFNPQQIAESGVLLGKDVNVRITHEEYNGEMQPRIASLLAAGDGATATSAPGATGGGFFSQQAPAA